MAVLLVDEGQGAALHFADGADRPVEAHAVAALADAEIARELIWLRTNPCFCGRADRARRTVSGDAAR